MADIGGSEGAGAFLKPDSALVRAALDLLSSHTAADADEEAVCGHCGSGYPCPTVEHARQVADAGGLAAAGSVREVPDPVGAA
jgi:hypothetical protein